MIQDVCQGVADAVLAKINECGSPESRPCGCELQAIVTVGKRFYRENFVSCWLVNIRDDGSQQQRMAVSRWTLAVAVEAGGYPSIADAANPTDEISVERVAEIVPWFNALPQQIIAAVKALPRSYHFSTILELTPITPSGGRSGYVLTFQLVSPQVSA